MIYSVIDQKKTGALLSPASNEPDSGSPNNELDHDIPSENP